MVNHNSIVFGKWPAQIYKSHVTCDETWFDQIVLDSCGLNPCFKYNAGVNMHIKLHQIPPPPNKSLEEIKLTRVWNPYIKMN